MVSSGFGTAYFPCMSLPLCFMSQSFFKGNGEHIAQRGSSQLFSLPFAWMSIRVSFGPGSVWFCSLQESVMFGLKDTYAKIMGNQRDVWQRCRTCVKVTGLFISPVSMTTKSESGILQTWFWPLLPSPPFPSLWFRKNLFSFEESNCLTYKMGPDWILQKCDPEPSAHDIRTPKKAFRWVWCAQCPSSQTNNFIFNEIKYCWANINELSRRTSSYENVFHLILAKKFRSDRREPFVRIFVHWKHLWTISFLKGCFIYLKGSYREGEMERERVT